MVKKRGKVVKRTVIKKVFKKTSKRKHNGRKPSVKSKLSKVRKLIKLAKLRQKTKKHVVKHKKRR
ncbi:hypothetical protein J4437_00540 [Candidatus Woesearchaeota archaeon]|nr:hypothetical protein [Candidatus Woesearchaeota archaeon]